MKRSNRGWASYLLGALIISLSGFSIQFESAQAAELKERLAVSFSDGSEQTVELKKETYETRYRYEQVEDTCSEQVLSHYTSVCSAQLARPAWFNQQKRRICTQENGRTVCRDDGSSSGGGGSSGGGSSGGDWGYSGGGYYTPTCYDQPVYETRYYSCVRTISIPYQVHLYTTRHQVAIQFGRLPPTVGEVNPKLVLASKDNGDLVVSGTAAVQGAISPVIMLGEAVETDEKESLSSGENPVYLRKWQVRVRFADTKAVFKPFTDASAALDLVDGKVILTLGPKAKKDDLKVTVDIKKDRLVFSDKRLVRKELTSSDFNLNEIGETTELDFALKDMMSWKKGRYHLNVELNLRKRDDILNVSELPSFQKVYKQKIRFKKDLFSKRE